MGPKRTFRIATSLGLVAGTREWATIVELFTFIRMEGDVCGKVEIWRRYVGRMIRQSAQKMAKNR